MAISRIEGKNYRYENGRIQFYGANGFRTDKGWCINWTPLGDVPVEVKPQSSILDDIRMCIEDDVAADKGEDIKVLYVTPENAAMLFLMGTIGVRNLKEIKEFDDHIDIPDFQIDKRFMTLRIVPDFEYGCATADADGNIL